MPISYFKNKTELTPQQMYDLHKYELMNFGWCIMLERITDLDGNLVEFGVYGLGAIIYTFKLVNNECVLFVSK